MKTPRIRQLAIRPGRTSIVAGVIGACTLFFYLYGVRPLQLEERSMQERVVELAQRPARQSGAPDDAAAAPSPDARLAEFYARLPDISESPEVVHQLHRNAREAGLALVQGEYRALPSASPKLLRYQMVMPVKGSYPQVRKFLLDAMNDIPGLALDGIDFRLEGGAPERIEAQLRFTVFLRTAS